MDTNAAFWVKVLYLLDLSIRKNASKGRNKLLSHSTSKVPFSDEDGLDLSYS